MAEAALSRAAATLGGLVFATVDATTYALILATDTAATDAVDSVVTALRAADTNSERVTAVVGEASSLGGVGASVGVLSDDRTQPGCGNVFSDNADS